MFALGLGIGLVLAAVGVIARDVSTACIKLLGLTMYLTPVIYLGTLPNPRLQPLLDFNPLTYLIDGPRSLLLFGHLAHPAAYAMSSALACLVLALGIHGFYLVQDHVAERI
jgi:lipopolysaccharide transport system permease protein